ncbi:ABC transporter ATP-binding protein [Cumulibacter soli]|uniref:ABC transporter ATP-binding protein n=1 Tax=Cumulibacter soli TaxID=2546344 RepID=UPI0010675411|nr:ABC transporter ATP-binding protein [Cumulibacter soli]
MTSTQQPLAIDLVDVTKSFQIGTQPVHAVRGVNLQIRPGEIVAFLGPNGAGKTTTLDMVLGLTTPTSGTARVLGLAPRAAIDAGRVSAVLQTGGLLSDITVRESVQMIASTYRDHTGVEQVIQRAGLRDIASRRVSKCSGGEQQRLRFALALLPDPDLLILDEPTAGMDVNARHDFWDTMRQDADAGRTVVFATHYLEEADDFADRIVLIASGRIVADGSTDEIRARAGGRTVSATFNETDIALIHQQLTASADVSDVAWRGPRAIIQTADSDELARKILGPMGGRDLEIVTANLDNAFKALTADVTSEQVSA